MHITCNPLFSFFSPLLLYEYFVTRSDSQSRAHATTNYLKNHRIVKSIHFNYRKSISVSFMSYIVQTVIRRKRLYTVYTYLYVRTNTRRKKKTWPTHPHMTWYRLLGCLFVTCNLCNVHFILQHGRVIVEKERKQKIAKRKIRTLQYVCTSAAEATFLYGGGLEAHFSHFAPPSSFLSSFLSTLPSYSRPSPLRIFFFFII